MNLKIALFATLLSEPEFKVDLDFALEELKREFPFYENTLVEKYELTGEEPFLKEEWIPRPHKFYFLYEENDSIEKYFQPGEDHVLIITDTWLPQNYRGQSLPKNGISIVTRPGYPNTDFDLFRYVILHEPGHVLKLEHHNKLIVPSQPELGYCAMTKLPNQYIPGKSFCCECKETLAKI